MRLPRIRGVAVLMVAGMAGMGTVRGTGNTEVITQSGTAIGNRVWHDASLPVVWRYHDPTAVPGCYSSTNAPPETLQGANQIGFDAWQNDPHSRIAFSFGGGTAVRDAGADGINLVTFCDSTVLSADPGFSASVVIVSLTVETTVSPGGGCPPGQGLLPAGFCFPSGTYPSGTIIDADIRYNTFGTFEESFATNGAIGGYHPAAQLTEVVDIAAHEVGHFVGLSHDPLPQATMFQGPGPNPPTDGIGKKVLKRSDLSTAGRYYPEPSYATAFGSITGLVTLNGVDADGVHVVAIDPVTMLGVAGRFSISRFEDPLALGPEGADFAAQGSGFYRIDGLPPGDYYVYVEYFDNSEFIDRLRNKYNVTVGNSNVAPGSGSAGALGFLPALAEFYDAAESANGGNGIDPGTALDNSDAATLVTVTAGSVTTGINIHINIEPVNGQTPSQRQNPTTRSLVASDAFAPGDMLWAFILDGGDDDYYAVRFPASLLPPPPYNVAEGVWIHGGLSTMPMVTSLAFADPGSPAIPDLGNPVVHSAGRVLTGGSGGALPPNFLNDVRDQWNVTINESRDIFAIVHQPDVPGAATPPEAYVGVVTCSDSTCTAPARVGRTLVTEDGGVSWSTLTNADLFYDLVVERDPPVMITGAVPGQMDAGASGDVLINGFGFLPGAAVDFGPDITVNTVDWLNTQQLRVNITIHLTGATAPRPVDVTVVNHDVVIPNVSRVFEVLPIPDDDGDGTPNLADCAPLDAALKSPATEVTNVQVSVDGGSAEISWDSQDNPSGSATSYDIIAGEAADLRTSGGFDMATCAASDHPDTPFADVTPIGLGQVRYWLVSACNACNMDGCTFGDSGLAPDPRDALDASSPCP